MLLTRAHAYELLALWLAGSGLVAVLSRGLRVCMVVVGTSLVCTAFRRLGPR